MSRYLSWLFATLVLSCYLAIGVSAAQSSDLPLADAVRKGDHAAVRQLLKSGADVNAAQPDGSTMLILAVERGDREMASLLIGARADVNARNPYGATALYAACARGDVALVRVLLAAGADPNATLLLGESPLMAAVDAGATDAVPALLQHGAKTEQKESKGGQTALMWAVAQDQPQIVRLLVDHGADVHAQSKTGFTPLLFAAQRGNVQSGMILLEAGAKVDHKAGRDGMSALTVAVASGRKEMSAVLLEKGADPNMTDAQGSTALHYAVGCAPQARTTICAEMSDSDRTEVVKALLAHRANPNARMVPTRAPRHAGVSLDGATALHIAAAAGNVGAVRALLAAGADPLSLTDGKTAPLHLAAGVGPPLATDWTEKDKANLFEVTKLLVELGADVNAVGEHGWTALHGAAYKGMDRVIELLVKNGAKMDVVDEYGQTPLSIAGAVITTGVRDYYDQTSRIPRASTSELLLKMGATPLTDSGVDVFALFGEENGVSPGRR